MTFGVWLRESKNVHMTHLEDAVIDGGVNGTRRAINYLRDLRDTLAGHTSKPMNISTKWDGCIHEDTIILTNLGDMKISDLIERYRTDEEIMVMGRVLDDIHHDTFTNIIAESVSEGEKKWVEITLEDGSCVKMTEDHEVHTSTRGWVAAGDLQEYDDITEL